MRGIITSAVRPAASVTALHAITGAWLEHKARVAVSVLAIALGVALGYAVQQIGRAHV